MGTCEVNVLLTSVGRRVELVRAFQRALRALDLRGQVVGVDVNPLAPALHVVDKPYIVPRLSSPEYVSSLVRVCKAERIGLVLPLIDPDIPVLATHHATIEGTGARLALVDRDAAEICADKWLTTAFFRDLGLATPATWLPVEVFGAAPEFPLFIKPRRGSASQHTFLVRNERELAFFAEYVPDPVVQECLPGPEITSDVVCDLTGAVLAVVSRQRIEVRSGEVQKGVTIFDPVIAEACARVAAALSARGPITIQCMLKEGVPHFTEINARLGGGVPLAIAAGADVPALLLARAAGLPVPAYAPGAYTVGLHVTRFDDSFFVDRNACEAMARGRL